MHSDIPLELIEPHSGQVHRPWAAGAAGTRFDFRIDSKCGAVSERVLPQSEQILIPGLNSAGSSNRCLCGHSGFGQ